MQETMRHIGDKQGNIYRVLLFLGCAALLVFFMPVDTKFQYEYAEDRVWKYDDLYSPFDYVILKPEDSLAVEEARIRESNTSYYVIDKDMEDRRKADFRERMTKNWDDSQYSMAKSGGLLNFNKREKDSLAKANHYKVGAKLLDKLFDDGIAQWTAEDENKGEEAEVFLIEGTKVKTMEKGDFRDLKSSYQYLERKLKKENDVDAAFLLKHLSDVLKYNVTYDAEKTNAVLEVQLSGLLSNIGKVTKDEKIIGRGEVVDKMHFLKLQSLHTAYEKQVGKSKDYYFVLGGQIVLVGLCLLALYIFLMLFKKEVLHNTKHITFLLLMVAIMGFLTHLSVRFTEVDAYVVPLCLLPLIIRAFFDAELALFVHIVTVLAVSFMVPEQFTFVFLHLMAGVVAVFSIVNLRKRSQFLFSVLLIFLTYALAWLGINVIESGQVEDLNYERLAWLGGNAAFALFSLPLIFIFEKLFGFVSETTLMELSDTNTPLLRELSATAPGTFQHTIQVANLAEAAVHAIGGDTLLVRTGALYHDIGKMKRPMYFIENQKGMNPHDELEPEESARIIIDHVIDGIEMARKHNLPDQITDFIRTHHGTTRTEYFYRTYLKNSGQDTLEDDAMFRYPGPLPYSKETAVLMMADSVEAAGRSLSDYSEASITGLVNGIINHQMNAGQFTNANITFKDISVAKEIFVKMLMNIYHVRIAYPK